MGLDAMILVFWMLSFKLKEPGHNLEQPFLYIFCWQHSGEASDSFIL